MAATADRAIKSGAFGMHNLLGGFIRGLCLFDLVVPSCGGVR